MVLLDLEHKLAYVAYLVWLAFGLWDFLLHRRSSLPTTSGLRESGLHGLQIAVVGCGVFVWGALESSWSVALFLLALALLHAFFGVWDTIVADQLRRVVPAEQHVHSVLDLAPWGFVGWVAWNADPTWNLSWSPLEPIVWLALIAPVVPAVLGPWLVELIECIAVKRRRASIDRPLAG
ncbi:hypothetical protein [Stenotrophomonas bentonitica]|uniref:hypothetical protein n=1 Tax=Stenotrophomonas bentonitica TaxID=1450134 RepID=UPI00345E777B